MNSQDRNMLHFIYNIKSFFENGINEENTCSTKQTISINSTTPCLSRDYLAQIIKFNKKLTKQIISQEISYNTLLQNDPTGKISRKSNLLIITLPAYLVTIFDIEDVLRPYSNNIIILLEGHDLSDTVINLNPLSPKRFQYQQENQVQDYNARNKPESYTLDVSFLTNSDFLKEFAQQKKRLQQTYNFLLTSPLQKKKLIQSYIDDLGINVPDDVCNYISTFNVDRSDQFCSLINKLHLLSLNEGQKITLHFAQRVIPKR